jgi:RNA polymerase sigma-70 factor (ECF subfamily)
MGPPSGAGFATPDVGHASRSEDASMSSPPKGRALPFPILGARERAHCVPVQTSEARTPSDEEVMARLQARDSPALSLLFDRYSRLLLGIALRILNDYGEAEEIVQEAFFYIYQKSALFDPAKGKVKTWIVQIAYHRALDRKSHLARRGFYLGTDLGSLDDTLLGKADLEREVGAGLDREQLEKAFEELPDMQRRTLDLFYFEGLELREISERLNESLGNVRHHFYRGLERLRKSALVRRVWGQ